MPVERAPRKPLPSDFFPTSGMPYRVQDGDDWYSVARRFNVDCGTLIDFNFHTRIPAEVNWYLRRNVGCRQATQDNSNWIFSSSADPGVIYIPPGPGAENLLIAPGPQCFAPAMPGSEPVDDVLRFRNLQIEGGLLDDADEYYRNGDFRWFFTYAHGQITRQINSNLQSFQRPNALLRLNIHFAEQFIRAIGGQPHADWQRVFWVCAGLQKGSDGTTALMGEVEVCGAAMAKVHIAVDLSAALGEIGCIPPEDYGNMLVFVNRGSLVALSRLRGRAVGAGEAILQRFLAPMVNLEVETWRNSVYMNRCNSSVPAPTLKVP